MDTRRISYSDPFRRPSEEELYRYAVESDRLLKAGKEQTTKEPGANALAPSLVPSIIAALYGANKKVSDAAASYMKDNALLGLFRDKQEVPLTEEQMQEEVAMRVMDMLSPMAGITIGAKGMANLGVNAERDLVGQYSGLWDKGVRAEVDSTGNAISAYQRTPKEVLEDFQHRGFVNDDDVYRGYAQQVEPFKDMSPDEVAARWKSKGDEVIAAAEGGDIELAKKLAGERRGEDYLLSTMTQRDFGPLNRYYSADDTFKAYPDLAEMHTRAGDNVRDDLGGAQGRYLRQSPSMGEQINLADARSYSKGDKSTIEHELQHAIQEREGFARGGSPRDFAGDYARARFLDKELSLRGEQLAGMPLIDYDNKLLRESAGLEDFQRKLDDFEQLLTRDEEYAAIKSELDALGKGAFTKPQDAYRRLAGEWEARNAGTRAVLPSDDPRLGNALDFNGARFRTGQPFSTADDISLRDMIVRMDGGEARSYDGGMNARELKAKLLRDIRRAKQEGYEDVGVRAFHSDQLPQTGQYADESYNWYDGDINLEEPLGGTAVFDPKYLDEALSYSLGGGERLSVLVGDGLVDHFMPEQGAKVLRDAKVYGGVYGRDPLSGVWDINGLRKRLKKP